MKFLKSSFQAHEIAAKYKGESEVWHPADIQNGNGHVNGNATTPTKNRGSSAEAQHIREKVSNDLMFLFRVDYCYMYTYVAQPC